MLKFCALLSLYGPTSWATDAIRVRLPHQVVDQGSLGICTLMASGVIYESLLREPVSRDGLLAWSLRGLILHSVEGWGGVDQIRSRLVLSQKKGSSRLFLQDLMENRLRNAPRQYLEMMDQQLPLSKDWKGPELLKLTEEELIERLLQVVESVNTATAPDRNGLTWAERIDGAFEKAFGSHPKDWGARGRLPNDVLFEGALQSQSDPRFERRLIENMIRDRPVGVSVDMGRVRVLQGQAYLLPVNTRSREELHAMVLVGLEYQGSEVKSVILRNSWGSDRHVGSGDFRISWHDFWQVNAGYFTFLSDLGDDHGSRLATLQLLMETRPRSPSPVEFLATHWSLDPFESVQVLEWLNRAEDLASWATFVSKQSSEWKRELLKTGYLYDEREFRRVRRILVEADQDPRSFFEKALGQELREWLSVMHRHLQAPRCPVAPFLRLVH